MYLHFYNVILILKCLIFLAACTKANKELIVNDTQSESNQNLKNYSMQDSQVNISNLFRRQAVVQSAKGAESFLPADQTLDLLNIPFSSNENALQILKAATISKLNTKNTTFDATIEYKRGNEINYNKNLTTLVNSANDLIKTTSMDNVEDAEKIMSRISPLPKETLFSILNFPDTSNNKAIEILNAATSSMLDNKNSTKEEKTEIQADKRQPETKNRRNSTASVIESKIDKEQSEIKNRVNSTTSVYTNNNRKTNTEVLEESNDQSPSTDIILSELTNLSHNDGEELTVGQKIKFQHSEMNSETKDTNTAGMEILKNISEICGSLFGKRISFANETTLMEFPWTVLLLYNTKIRYHCGGSLITTKYVLTAAHCVAQEFYELTGVRLGEHDITKSIDCAPDLVGNDICATTTDVDVVKIIVHHAYSHLSFKNDIALLRLDNDYISRSYYPICIQTSEMPYDDTKGIVAGWGATEKAIRSAVLLKADVPIFVMSKCREIYRYSVFNDSTEMCGSGENEVDVCKGDSGGALFQNRYFKGKDKYYQLGIISLGVRRCGDNRFLPAVFTKLQGFYKWIENNLEY